MTSTVASVRSQIVTTVEALTPEYKSSLVYKVIDYAGRSGSSAASQHRRFFFQLAGGGEPTDFESSLTHMEHQFGMVMTYQDHAANENQYFDRIATDAVQILRAINTVSNWPAGVDYVRCSRFDIQPGEGESDEIVFSITALVQEAD